MRSFWNENLEKLKRKHPELYRQVKNYTPKDIAEIVPTRTVPNLRLKGAGERFAYDVRDPLSALKSKHALPILENEKNLNKTICIFTGMGLGYGPLTILERRRDLFRAVILEPCLDIFVMALQSVDLGALLVSDRVYILAGDINWKAFDTIINDKSFEADFILSDMPQLFAWQPERYATVKHKAEAYASRAVSSMGVLTQYGEQLFENRISNLTLFRQACPVDRLAGAFKGLPAILVSAGPSLGDSLALLKQAKGRAVIIAVDSAAVPLMNHGIVPDFVTALDFRSLNSEKLSPDIVSCQDFCLVINIFTAPLTAKRLRPYRLFFSFQENDTQGWLMDELNVRHKMPPVNSVALLSLSLAQMFRADPIVLVGHDFALTSKETDHVKGAVFSWGWHCQDKYIQVPGVDGRPVNTLRFLFEFRQNFETLIRQHPGRYVNATAKGAHIEGTQVKTLSRVFEQDLKKTFNARQIIDTHAVTMDSIHVHSLIKSARRQLNIADRTHKQVKAVISQNRKIQGWFDKHKKAGARMKQFAGLPGPVQAALEKRNGLRVSVRPFIPMEEIASRYIQQAKDVKKTLTADTSIAQLEIDAAAVGLEMTGHERGLAGFKKQVKRLVSYLETEDRLLKGINEGKHRQKRLLDLLKLFVEQGDAAKALALVDETGTAGFDKAGDALMLEGESRAMLLDFEGAFFAWDECEKCAPELRKQLIKKRQQIAETWILEGVKEYAVIDTWLNRARRICADKSLFLKFRGPAWEKSVQKINTMIQNGSLDQARDFLLVWDAVKGVCPEWPFCMAQLSLKAGKKDEALALAQCALDMKPDNARFMAFHARVLMESGQVGTGIAQLERAIGVEPGQAVVWEEIGDLLFKGTDYEGAAIAYEKCVAVLPERTAVLKKFGDCYLKSGQFEQARAVYRLVLKRDGMNPEVRQRLADLEAGVLLR